MPVKPVPIIDLLLPLLDELTEEELEQLHRDLVDKGEKDK